MQRHEEIIIKLTERAIKRVKHLMENQNKKNFGLRVALVPGGCSGFMYSMEFEKDPKEGDIIVEQNGIKIFVDSESADTIKNSTVDFVQTLKETGFKFDNPNITHTCECGHSVH